MKNLQSHVLFYSFFFFNSMLIVKQPLKENEFPSEVYYHYFSCTTCKTKTSIMNNTVLSNSNRKLCEFVILVPLLWQPHRMYKTVQKETCLMDKLPSVTAHLSLVISPWTRIFGPAESNPRAQRIKICRIPLTLNNLWPLTLGVSFATIAINVAMNILMQKAWGLT